MGFTPLAGLVMATRCGDLDPGLLLWLSSRERDLATTLETRSGLLGLAGTGDMRELLASAESAPTAQLAIDIYVHRLRQGIAAMAASMNGVDACVFTGGVGQNSAEIRRQTVAGLGFLGLDLDQDANDSVTTDADVSSPAATVRTLVVASREDLEMAAQARRLVPA
jgi:acetate kinase